MMTSEDVFKEQIIKKEKTKKDKIKKLIILTLAVTFCITLPGIIGIEPSTVIIFVVMFATYYVINLFNVEYEYAYTNGTLDIDCIRNKSRRKTVFSGDVSEFEIMAHISDTGHLGQYSSLKTKDFSSGEILGNTYVFVASYKGKNQKFIIEPNNEILNLMYQKLGVRKFFKKM